MAALTSQRDQAWKVSRELATGIAAGTVEPGVYDQDGDWLYNKESYQELLLNQAEAAEEIARSAFVIVLHHYWEKSIVEWMRTKRYKATAAYVWLESQGLKVDRNGLESLRLTANKLKHDGAREAIGGLTENYINQMFEAVRASGPSPDSAFAVK